MDLISRQAAIDEVDEWIKAFRENGHKESAADACLIQDGIIQLPSAQPERKTGKWCKAYADHEAFGIRPFYRYCSYCNEITVYPYKYCPNCGARMEAGGED